VNRLRAALAVLGVATAGLGLAMAANPSLATALPSDRDLVRLAGALIAVQGGRVLWHRHRSELDAGTVPEPAPEETPEATTPGAGFDDLATAATAGTDGRVLTSRQERLHRRLRRTAVEALVRYRDYDREEAAASLDDGTWTDDPAAAAFFTGSPVEDPGSLTGRSAVTRRANRAAIAIAELTGADRPRRSDEEPVDGSDQEGTGPRERDERPDDTEVSREGAP
jgi:hypothetical protein